MGNQLINHYFKLCDQQQIEKDNAQLLVVNQLQKILDNVDTDNNWLNKIFSKPKLQGLYIYGSVGCGKTFLMDLFFDNLANHAKLRLHFYRFMSMIHAELGSLKSKENPIKIIAKKLSKKYKIICFDEFFINEIGDAMLLGNLFKEFYQLNITLIATSNVAIEDLYKDGLQRQNFLPTIKLLKNSLSEVHLKTATDYRLQSISTLDIFTVPANASNLDKIKATFIKLARDKYLLEHEITILGRIIKTKGLTDDIVWFNFLELCDGPRSQNDYIELAKIYHTILISGIPVLKATDEAVARRFIALIDELYDRRVNLITTADSEFNLIYQGSQLKFEFKRTISRLREMQTEEYLKSAHLI